MHEGKAFLHRQTKRAQVDHSRKGNPEVSLDRRKGADERSVGSCADGCRGGLETEIPSQRVNELWIASAQSAFVGPCGRKSRAAFVRNRMTKIGDGIGADDPPIVRKIRIP